MVEALSSISVVIPTRQLAPPVTKTIESVLAQDCQIGEVIVVFRSKDQSFEAPISGLVRFVHEAGPSGGDSQRQRGFLESTGQVVCFIDDDVLLPPNYIRLLVELLLSDVKFGLVSGRFIDVTAPRSLVDEFVSTSNFRPTRGASGIEEVELIPSTSWIARREAIRQIGGLLPRFQFMTAGQDHETCDRIRRAGFRLAYNYDVVGQHSRNSTLGGFATRCFLSGVVYAFRWEGRRSRLEIICRQPAWTIRYVNRAIECWRETARGSPLAGFVFLAFVQTLATTAGTLRGIGHAMRHRRETRPG